MTQQRVLIVGGSGTIGKRLVSRLSATHTVVTAGRNSGDARVDIRSTDAIARMYREIGAIDACVSVAASGAPDTFQNLTEAELLENMRGKLFGQINLVLLGKAHLADRGSFTLTSGIFADQAWKGVTGGAVVSGALHSFVLSAAIELERGLRINVVSPGMVADAAHAYGHLFPGMPAVPMDRLVDAYVQCVEGERTGEILRVYS
jgi:NAD(P)-dependent dehydrogenase (short-subunit alcohol dehydrogenase family)